MKLALHILLYIMVVVFGIGIIGDENKINKEFYIIAFIASIILIILIQRIWI